MIALTPFAGRTVADVYMLWLVKVNNRRSISMRLLSNSLLVPTDVLHPTPLCQIAYETLLLPVGDLGNVKSAKNSISIRVSISSSASGFTSSNSSPAACSLTCSSGDSSKITFRAKEAFLQRNQVPSRPALTGDLPSSLPPHAPEELVLP